MPRYIDAEDFERRLEHPPYTIYNGEMFAEWYDECMKSQPTADVQEVKHGRWIAISNGNMKHWKERCSECGIYTRGQSPFCKNCGAKMDGGKQE